MSGGGDFLKGIAGDGQWLLSALILWPANLAGLLLSMLADPAELLLSAGARDSSRALLALTSLSFLPAPGPYRSSSDSVGAALPGPSRHGTAAALPTAAAQHCRQHRCSSRGHQQSFVAAGVPPTME